MSSTAEIVKLPQHGDYNHWSDQEKALADAAGLVKRKTLQGGQVEVTIAPRATIEAFLQLCRITQLNPFIRQIYCIERGGKWGTEVSIDGARLVAHRTGQFEGYEEISFSADGGETWADSFKATEVQLYPTHARVGVWRTGFRKPVTVVARWESFAVYHPEWENRKIVGQKLSEMWGKMPDVMLSKVAEMQALRRAFPNDLADVYVAEEMYQADAQEARPVAQTKPWAELAAACKTKADVLALFAECRGKKELTDDLDDVFKKRLDELPESLPPEWAEPEPEPSAWVAPGSEGDTDPDAAADDAEADAAAVHEEEIP